jgi:hypothetical protein
MGILQDCGWQDYGCRREVARFVEEKGNSYQDTHDQHHGKTSQRN